jgi:hypothetical protein
VGGRFTRQLFSTGRIRIGTKVGRKFALMLKLKTFDRQHFTPYNLIPSRASARRYAYGSQGN